MAYRVVTACSLCGTDIGCAIVLRTRYAMCGTELAYGATRVRVYQRRRYVVCGTGIAYGAAMLRGVRYCQRWVTMDMLIAKTQVNSHTLPQVLSPLLLHFGWALSGTGAAYWHRLLRICYAMCGTETGYAATRLCACGKVVAPYPPTHSLCDVRY
eukprot:1736479-Rhodomonas_salina.2